MKRSIIIAFAFLFSTISLMAQNMDNPKVQELRKAFYSEKLQFTPEESNAFWPVFEKYQADEKKLKKKYNPNADTGPMSDIEIEQHLNNLLEYGEKKAALKKEYVNNDFKKALPVRKVAMLDQVERQFKQHLFNKVRKNRQGNKRPNQRQ